MLTDCCSEQNCWQSTTTGFPSYRTLKLLYRKNYMKGFQLRKKHIDGWVYDCPWYDAPIISCTRRIWDLNDIVKPNAGCHYRSCFALDTGMFYFEIIFGIIVDNHHFYKGFLIRWAIGDGLRHFRGLQRLRNDIEIYVINAGMT